MWGPAVAGPYMFRVQMFMWPESPVCPLTLQPPFGQMVWPPFYQPGPAPGAAYSVCVSGGVDVYVAGNDGPVAKLWKNGVPASLTSGATAAVAYWVTVFLPDVYAVGYEMVGSKSVAKLWKNGGGTSLTDGTNNAVAYSVYVTSNGAITDMYVAGYENNGTKNVAKFWKNGVPTSLTDGTKNAIAYSVRGSGSDVYVGGYENDGTKNIAKLYKNGLEFFLPNSANAGSITGVFVK
jgi:hypothetical protein